MIIASLSHVVLIRRCAGALVLALGLTGCASTKTISHEVSGGVQSTLSADAEISALVAAHDAWIAAINRGEIQQGLDGMTEDAVIVGSDGPVVHGSAEVRERVAQLTRVPGLNIRFTLTKASVSPDKRVGFVIGDSTISASDSSGVLRTTSQRLLTVWRKDPGQGWRCYLDAPMRAPSASNN